MNYTNNEDAWLNPKRVDVQHYYSVVLNELPYKYSNCEGFNIQTGLIK